MDDERPVRERERKAVTCDLREWMEGTELSHQERRPFEGSSGGAGLEPRGMMDESASGSSGAESEASVRQLLRPR